MGIFDNIVDALNLEHLIQLPIAPKRALIWDENKTARNLANAIWTIIVNEILVNRTSLENMDFERVRKIVKGEITSSIKAYSNKSLSQEIGRLGLMEFLASQHVTGI